jgi:hypothetical protein
MLRAVLTFCLIFLLFSVSPAQQTEGGANKNQGKVIFKAKTEFPAQLENAVYSEKINVGDDVNFTLTEDVIGEGDKIEKGSTLYGRVVSVEKIAPNNDTAKVCILFDFVKKGEEYLPLVASILAIEAVAEDIKFAPSPTFTGGTVLSLKGKELHLDKGKILRVRLMKDITAK